MFDAMGVNWAGTMLALVATALVPIPAAFWYYGERIRARSPFAPTLGHMPGADSIAGEPAPVVVEKTSSRRANEGDNAV
jgi:DHA1 family multidrug resistance protein-like MFS transporter